jgi:hypothetical protein
MSPGSASGFQSPSASKRKRGIDDRPKTIEDAARFALALTVVAVAGC